MPTYTFDIILSATDFTDADADRLYEAGTDDATIVTRLGVTRAIFDREADSLEAALHSATADVRRAGQIISRIEMQAPAPVQRVG